MSARVLKWVGLVGVSFGVVFISIVAASPLGLVSAYPRPPKEAVDGPLGATKKIVSVASLMQRPDEPQAAYFRRLTIMVNEGMTHYWIAGDEWAPSDARYTAISPFDNYLLWLQGIIQKYAFLHNYEFIAPSKAIDRGYGFCSQLSKIVHSVLKDQAIRADVLENPGHVIVQADGMILDADFGVFIGHSVEWMQHNIEAVEVYYRRFPWMWPVLKRVYSEGGGRLTCHPTTTCADISPKWTVSSGFLRS